MKKPILFTLICLMCMSSLFAQCDSNIPVFKGGNVSPYLRGYYYNYFDNRPYQDTACISGITYLKFVVEGEGKLSGISCSVGTPEYLAQDLIACVKATEGLWEYKGTDNPYFLMPVVYLFQCGSPKNTKSEEERYKHLLESVSNLNWFTTNVSFQDRVKYRQEIFVPAIILTPMYITGAFVHRAKE